MIFGIVQFLYSMYSLAKAGIRLWVRLGFQRREAGSFPNIRHVFDWEDGWDWCETTPVQTKRQSSLIIPPLKTVSILQRD